MEPLDSINRWSDRLRDRARARSFFAFLWRRFLGRRIAELAARLSR
jgi:membrane protein